LCEVFKTIQETVSSKFPGEEMVRYTSVSGFIILRFFAPAILCPPLFGLKIGILDQQASRKLTLIAKTLQNLGNLVEFGQKEAFMSPMNVFINSKVSGMKRFLDEISSSAPIPLKKPGKAKANASADDPYVGSLKNPKQVSRDCADLVAILGGGVDKLKTMNLDPNLLRTFLNEINSLNLKAEELDSQGGIDKAKKDLIWNDLGVDFHE
jgi:GTPase-activator protein for Ras-like GTPase